MTSTSRPTVLPGAEAWSHRAAAGPGGEEPTAGVLVVHGFTGNPSSVRTLAEAFAGAGFHVEVPRLPGHGTTIDDVLTTGWDDWTGEVEAAYGQLRERAADVVVAGLSMGGSLALWTGLAHPEVRGLVCINPVTTAQPAVRAQLEGLLAAGTDVLPGIGSDIADPEAHESAYDGTPVRPALSFVVDGLEPMAGRYAELAMPLLLLTSRQDHVVAPSESEHLAEQYGGPVDHRWLERSYHVATQDFDRDVVALAAIEFATEVTAS